MNCKNPRIIWKPEIYQGQGKNKNYFEGWYFKIVAPDGENIYCIIPGISLGQDSKTNHAFIQIINGISNISKYFSFGRDKFKYSKNKFEINIEDNYFSLDRINLDIKNQNEYIQGELFIKNCIPWTSNIFSSGTMGWYSFIPFMECYHHCISLDHEISGWINDNGKYINFNCGKGYMEKDWGRSFPSSWIWSQGNHFEDANVSIMISIANIPWMHKFFTGFIIGFLFNGFVYKFTTYNGSKLKKVKVHDNAVEITVYNKISEIEIIIIKSDGGKLYSPKNGDMIGELMESNLAILKIKFYKVINNKREIIYEGKSKYSGLEVMGNLQEIII